MVYDFRIDGFPAVVDLRAKDKKTEKKCECKPCGGCKANEKLVDISIEDNTDKKTPRCFDCL